MHLREHNVRTGFFEWEDFVGFLPPLPRHDRPLFQLTYITGRRVRSELLTRLEPRKLLRARHPSPRARRGKGPDRWPFASGGRRPKPTLKPTSGHRPPTR